MAFWWVNHNRKRDFEVRGGYLWSPFRNKNGAFNQTYENMTLVRPGDLVFSFANGQIGAIGQVTEAASASPRPTALDKSGTSWANEGWLVSVYFTPVPKPLHPTVHAATIAPLLPTRYSPIQSNGKGNQYCYLAGIPDALGHLLLDLVGIETTPVFASRYRVQDPGHDASLLADLDLIEHDRGISDTQRLQLAKARIGQGLFRKRVLLKDPRCKVTGIEDERLLVASHIKPWRDSTNLERLNGANGVMLSPHVDALFDKHLLTFEDDGKIRVHAALPQDVLDRWSIQPDHRVERFRPEQRRFLAHHRKCFAQRLG